MDLYRARLVPRGFKQQTGVDFAEAFSPVIKPTTVRQVLTLALTFSWPIRQLDIFSAFLYGDIPEIICIKQPEGFIDQ